ncbi:MAG TPA: hypothetical protein VJV79_20770 [Polyangiaceae bacterium]|nr:hypothetical protein [Polyangiaceae bacterium]
MKQRRVKNSSWGRSLVALALATVCGATLSVAGCGSSNSGAAVAGAGAGGEAGASDAGAAGVMLEGGAAGEGAAGEGGAPTLTEQGMFDALGIDTAASPRTYVDANEKTHTLDDGYNPLGRGTRSLQPRVELYVAGRTLGTSTANQFLLDSAGINPAKKALPITDAADSWAGNLFTKSLAADLDGDGVDEIVNVYYIEASKELHANVIRCSSGCEGDGGAFSNVKDTKLTVQDAGKVPLDRHWFSHGLLASDTDGDGKQELLVANFGGIDVCVASKAFVFSCTPRVTNPSQRHSLARGHLNDDPQKLNDDVVAAWSDDALAYVSIYDGSTNSFAADATTNANRDPIPLSVKFLDDTSVTSYAQAFVDLGDVDLDGRDEIVISGRKYIGGDAGWAYDLFLMDDAQTTYRFFKGFRFDLGLGGGTEQFGNNNSFHPALKVFNKSRSPYAKAIYAGIYILDNLQNLMKSSATSFESGYDLNNKLRAKTVGYYEDGGGSYNHGPNEVVVGDLDGNGYESVVGFWDVGLIGSQTAYPQKDLSRIVWDPNKSAWTEWTTLATTTGGLAPVSNQYDLTYGVGLALANVDRDSPIVEYTGKHEVLFSEPRVLAVLAAAPYFEGENESNSSTSISFGDGQGVETESTIGLRSSTSIGYTAPNLFGTTEFETKLTFGFSTDWISSQSVTLEQTQTWTAGNEDAVVFQVIPFDVYYYNVVSSPMAEDVGTAVTINVPRKLNTYKVPVALYNKSIVNGPTVGSGLLRHTVGDPSSYPDSNPCQSASDTQMFGSTSYLIDPNEWCYASADTLHVGVGTGSVGFSIARSEGSSEGTNTDLSVDFEVTVGAGGVSFGQSVGFHYGYTYTVDSSRSYSFSGQVGDLANAKRGYDFGLAAHRGVLSGLGTSYPVFLVDYWVKNVE